MTDNPNIPVKASRPLSSRREGAPAEPFGWLRTEIDRLFEDFGGPARNMLNLGMRSLAPVPALDMTDEKGSYRLTAELPGLDETDIEISVADGILSISGEKKEENECRDKGFMLNERRHGAFERRIALPDDVDAERIKAQFKDGLLVVTMAKDEKAPARSRKIAIEKS